MGFGKDDMYSRQWEDEISFFFRALESGKAFVDGGIAAVEWGRSDNDPRWIYYREGEDRLTDDHFSMQHSRPLTDSELRRIAYAARDVYGADIEIPEDGGVDGFYESRLRGIIRESVRNVLGESYDQFSDTDFASEDPYAFDDWFGSEEPGTLDGRWAFNGAYVDVEDSGHGVVFRIEPRNGGGPFEVAGEDAESMKSEALHNISDGCDTAHAIWKAVTHRCGGRL